MIHSPFELESCQLGFRFETTTAARDEKELEALKIKGWMGRVEREKIPTNRFGWKEVLKSGCVV